MRILESTSSNPLDRPLEDTIWWTWCKSSNVYTRYMHTGVTNKHNGRRPDFLIVADLSVISVHVLYIRVHLTRMDTVRVLVLYILAWIPSVSTAYPLVPRVNASICFAPLCFVPPLFLHPLYPPPQSIVSSSTYDALAVTFVRSFVRSCYSRREHPAVSETSMRDSSSFLDSPLSPLWHLFASPFLLPTRSPPAYSFAELVPSPFPRPRISLANRYFSAAFLPVYTYVYMTWLPRARTMPCPSDIVRMRA